MWSFGDRLHTYYSVTWSVDNVKNEPNQLSTCITFTADFLATERVCERREIPAGWTSGQPLKHVEWTGYSQYHHELANILDQWNWSDKNAPQSVSRTDLKTTSEPINNRGISGAVLSALLDAYTPRAGGMNALPQRAGGATNVYSTTPKDHDPAFASLHHESRATNYADGNPDGTGYSPAVGPYAYALKAGAWQSDTAIYGPGKTLPGTVLTLNLQNDAQKGLILPGSTSLTVQALDNNGKVTQEYQGEQVSDGKADKTIAPNDLLMFGYRVQTWTDPNPDPKDAGRWTKAASVWLTVEQSLEDARSVDLCWNSILPGFAQRTYCTTTTIPEGWTAGQPLLPQSYHIVSGDETFWNTRIAH